MDDTPSFGSWIRRRRKALDLTQERLAQRVGLKIRLRCTGFVGQELAALQRLVRWHGRYAWACGGKRFAPHPACALPASRKESGR